MKLAPSLVLNLLASKPKSAKPLSESSRTSSRRRENDEKETIGNFLLRRLERGRDSITSVSLVISILSWFSNSRIADDRSGLETAMNSMRPMRQMDTRKSPTGRRLLSSRTA